MSSTAASKAAGSPAATAGPAEGVHALQLEVGQRCYMDEAPPYPWDAKRATALSDVLRKLVAVLAAWRPPA
jgi:N-formylglutamate deformylase